MVTMRVLVMARPDSKATRTSDVLTWNTWGGQLLQVLGKKIFLKKENSYAHHLSVNMYLFAG